MLSSCTGSLDLITGRQHRRKGALGAAGAGPVQAHPIYAIMRTLFALIRAIVGRSSTGPTGGLTLAAAEKPARVHSAPVAGLPVALTSFIGRSGELAALRQLVDSSRLLTLVGPGGVGKTRLARALAAAVAEAHAGPIAYLDLAPLAEPHAVAVTVARALGHPSYESGEGDAELVALIGDRPVLLILDNCEHLTEACANLVATLLPECPGLTVLATSRELLDVGGEVPWRVPPLSVPEPGPCTAASLTEAESVQLFLDRSSRVRPGFTLTDADAAPVAEICRRLDGLPLALELAAARMRVMSPRQISVALEDQLAVLTGGGRGGAARQRTMRASLDWSHALLTEPEQLLLRRLAVFAGGFDLAAAEAVATGTGLARHHILDQLGMLVDKSLVSADSEAGGELTFRLLETVRQYAAERCAEAGESDAVARRHRDHYLALVEDLATYVDGPSQDAVLELLAGALDNLRAAFAWSRGAAEPEAALRIATALYGLWRKHARLVEGAAWLDEALSDVPSLEDAAAVENTVRLRALLVRCRLESREDGEVAATRVEESVRLARTTGDKGLLAHALIAGAGYLARGPRRHRESLLEALALAEEIGDSGLQVEARAWLGIVSMLAGDPSAAIAQLRAARAPAAEAGNSHTVRSIAALTGMSQLMQGQAAAVSHELAGLAAEFAPSPPESAKVIILAMTGWAAALGGDHDAAAVLMARAVTLTRPRARWLTLFGRMPGGMTALAAGRAEDAVEQFALGWHESGGTPGAGDLTLAALAEARFAAGDLDGARAAAEKVLARCTAEPLRWQEGLARLVLARLARARGDTARADRLALDALGLFVSVEADGPAADVLEFLAAGLAAADAVGAARLLGAADAIRDRLGYRRLRVHAGAVAAAVASVETTLGPDAEAARAEGAGLSVADAVAYANRGRGSRGRPPTGWASLTPTEADVVRLVAEGLRNKDIADRLFASPRTVQTHLTHVYAKLGVSSRVQLVNEMVRLREATDPADPTLRT